MTALPILMVLMFKQGGFSPTSRDIFLSGNTLQAQDEVGFHRWSTVDLTSTLVTLKDLWSGISQHLLTHLKISSVTSWWLVKLVRLYLYSFLAANLYEWVINVEDCNLKSDQHDWFWLFRSKQLQKNMKHNPLLFYSIETINIKYIFAVYYVCCMCLQ